MSVYSAIDYGKFIYKDFLNEYNLNHLNYKADLLIINLLNKLDIVCDYLPIRIESFCGMLTIDQEETSILINNKLIKSRRLFTVSHELGHYFLHRKFQSQFQDHNKNIIEDTKEMLDSTIDSFELEANIFASEIMVPELVLQSMLNSKFNYYRICKSIGVSNICLKMRIIRHLKYVYFLTNKNAERVVEEYQLASKERRPKFALIFLLNKYKNPNYHIENLLDERMKQREKEKDDNFFYIFD